MYWRNALRQIELTDDEMKGRVCGCRETGNPDEYGDGSSLPCMSMDPDNDLRCKQCIYCMQREDAERLYANA